MENGPKMNLIEHPISLDITYFFLFVFCVSRGRRLINIRTQGKVSHLRNQTWRSGNECPTINNLDRFQPPQNWTSRYLGNFPLNRRSILVISSRRIHIGDDPRMRTVVSPPRRAITVAGSSTDAASLNSNKIPSACYRNELLLFYVIARGAGTDRVLSSPRFRPIDSYIRLARTPP